MNPQDQQPLTQQAIEPAFEPQQPFETHPPNGGWPDEDQQEALRAQGLARMPAAPAPGRAPPPAPKAARASGKGTPFDDRPRGGSRKGGGGKGKLLATLLIIVLTTGGGGGYYWLHHASGPKRLAGMGQMDAEAFAPANHTSAHTSAPDPAQNPTQGGIPGASPTDAAVLPPGVLDQTGEAQGNAALNSPTSLGALPQATGSPDAQTRVQPQPEGAATSPEHTASAPVLTPAATPTAALPHVDSAAAPAVPATASGDGAATAVPTADAVALEQRVRMLEMTVQSLQAQLNTGSRNAAPSSGAVAAASAPARHARAARSRAQPASAAVAAAVPALGAQLLSVDMWGGLPSVVVTSGIAGDNRTRTLRPGDTLNGVTLQSADPATGSATFTSEGRTFTLSTRNGG